MRLWRAGIMLSMLGTIAHACAVSDEQFEWELKKTEQFVRDAVDYFKTHSLFTACRDFVVQAQWNGPVRMLFVLDADNRCLVFDHKLDAIWRPFASIQSLGNTPFLSELHMKAQGTGGWVTGEWIGALVHVYAQIVEKEGKSYLIGALCFSWSPRTQVEALAMRLRAAVAAVGLEAVVPKLSNPRGDFVQGSYGVYLFSYDGICRANPFISETMGKSIAGWVDDAGHALLPAYQNLLMTHQSSGWLSYSFGGAIKKDFVSELPAEDHEKNFFVIGYYPACDEDMVKEFLAGAIEQARIKGIASLSRFDHPYVRAGLSIIVYDAQGTVLAHSAYPALLGINAMNERDEQLHFRTKEIIDKLNAQGTGFIVTTYCNAPMILYGARVHDLYYVVRGYTSRDRYYQAIALNEEIVDYIRNLTKETLFADIVRIAEKLVLRGGLVVEIYDAEGYCWYSTLSRSRVWKRLKRPFPTDGWITRKLKKGTYRCYVKNVDKEGYDHFVVCVGYHE